MHRRTGNGVLEPEHPSVQRLPAQRCGNFSQLIAPRRHAVESVGQNGGPGLFCEVDSNLVGSTGRKPALYPGCAGTAKDFEHRYLRDGSFALLEA